AHGYCPRMEIWVLPIQYRARAPIAAGRRSHPPSSFAKAKDPQVTMSQPAPWILGPGSAWLLQQGKGVVDDGTDLIAVALHIAAQAGMPQGEADILEEAVLYRVIDPQIAFPFGIANAGGRIDV